MTWRLKNSMLLWETSEHWIGIAHMYIGTLRYGELSGEGSNELSNLVAVHTCAFPPLALLLGAKGFGYLSLTPYPPSL